MRWGFSTGFPAVESAVRVVHKSVCRLQHHLWVPGSGHCPARVDVSGFIGSASRVRVPCNSFTEMCISTFRFVRNFARNENAPVGRRRLTSSELAKAMREMAEVEM